VWVYGADGKPVTYGDDRLDDEVQYSVYNFELADADKLWKRLDAYEAECQELLNEYARLIGEEKEKGKKERVLDEEFARDLARQKARFPLLPAYDLCLKCSHLFNLLDARGAISVTERVGIIARIRALAVQIAKAWVDQQKAKRVEPRLTSSAVPAD
jgi:glycyl-tRNA synthetase alpha chain